ncbi:unnamed protein product [Caenorhabditis bovis]|uniref:Glycosylphosphatidylinositol anchor biosynthesis protein 11 n=1 Tax=Caenorhabditis bovis TaxID=2654633 RepID=A0A8S1F922_9PELO|nr:unnamed protein product [Caenorhabditis bovis]
MVHLDNFVEYTSKSFAIFYASAILFGAPLLSDFIGTAVLAATLTALAAVPAFFTGENYQQIAERLTRLNFRGPRLLDTIRLSCGFCAILGAWLGAFVHPLDWDRWWQRYPLPSLAGSVLGFFFGTFTGFFIRES